MAGQRGSAADEGILGAERAPPRRERRGQHVLREPVAGKKARLAEADGSELAREGREARWMDRFGAEVDPDVNWTNAMSSSAGSTSGSASGASHCSCAITSDSEGQRGRRPSNAGASAALVTTALAPAARRMPAVSWKYRDRSPAP